MSPVQCRYATGWTVRRSNPGRARFSAPVQTGPGAHPASCKMGTGSFPGRGIDHPPPSRAEVKERVELYLYSPSGPSWPVLCVVCVVTLTGVRRANVRGHRLRAAGIAENAAYRHVKRSE